MQLQPPTPIPDDARFKVFLAGSIEMGTAPDWQSQVVTALAETEGILVLNPRRDDWDSSWEQTIENTQFSDQVNWELDGIEAADLVLFYFAAGTRSPVTLLELGLCARGKRAVVCCPDGFWRKGNVDIVCERSGIARVCAITDLIEAVRRFASCS